MSGKGNPNKNVNNQQQQLPDQNRIKYLSDSIKLEEKIRNFNLKTPPSLSDITQAYSELTQLTTTYYSKLIDSIKTSEQYPVEVKSNLEKIYTETLDDKLEKYKNQKEKDTNAAKRIHKEYYSDAMSGPRWTRLFEDIRKKIEYYENKKNIIAKKYKDILDHHSSVITREKDQSLYNSHMQKEIPAIPDERINDIRYSLKEFEKDINELGGSELLKTLLADAEKSDASTQFSKLDNEENFLRSYIIKALPFYSYLGYELATSEVKDANSNVITTANQKTTANSNDLENVQPTQNEISTNNQKPNIDNSLDSNTLRAAETLNLFKQMILVEKNSSSAPKLMPFTIDGKALIVMPKLFPDPVKVLSLIDSIEDEGNCSIVKTYNGETIEIKANTDEQMDQLTKTLQAYMSTQNKSAARLG